MTSLAQDPEHVRKREWQQKIRDADPEAERERQRAWYAANRERVCAKKRAWREANKEKVQERQRNYYAKNRESILARRDPIAERDRHLRRTFGITLDEYKQMLAAQGGDCFICRSSDPVSANFAVDHDHATGEIRGLLCDLCNKGLGHFRDSEESLIRALEYLRRHREGSAS